MRVDFLQIEPTGDEAGPLSALQLALETDPVQAGLATGLTFVVIIRNTGFENVILQNPDDMLQVRLTDKQGRPVPLPFQPPSALINTRDADGSRPVSRNLDIRPGDERRTIIRVREIQRAGSAERDPLTPGIYTAHVKALLLLADSSLAREQSFRVLESPPVSVQVGE